ncbi:hypothetical protein [Sediminibacillus massiliensis]|uniref:hypothetical protein n=1 Tax=Sediminibacillus massiliensis TaxID=1926277 RepID=UPI00098877FA|nr:hypothetical protein [Sediminibacillus massiliensis]
MLRIAKDSGLTDVVSDDGSNPIQTQHPISGSSETIQAYLFNDDSTKRYESITITPEDTTDTDESSWIELSLDGTNFSSSISPADISDTSAHAFYVRVTTPSVSDTQNKTDIKLSVTGTEFAV